LIWRKTQDSNPYALLRAAVFKTAATPIWLAFRNKKENCEESVRYRKKSHISSFSLGEINLAGAFRFELKTSVLETDILPIETTRLQELKIKN
jgi:hypothetical protein